MYGRKIGTGIKQKKNAHISVENSREHLRGNQR